MPKEFQYQIFTGPRKPSREICGVFKREPVAELTDAEFTNLYHEMYVEWRKRFTNRKTSPETTE